MNASELNGISHQVIASFEQQLRRKFSQYMPSTLRDKYSNGCDTSEIVYKKHQENGRHHNFYEDDRGYVDFYDRMHERHIYIVEKKVGYSKLFHEEFNIKRIFDVIRPCSNHDHSNGMTPYRKEWFITNIEYICLQMHDSSGNIAIFCHTGRSRSPMYVVAYLILFCGFHFATAMDCIERVLLEQRNLLLDRHNTLYEIVAFIEDVWC